MGILMVCRLCKMARGVYIELTSFLLMRTLDAGMQRSEMNQKGKKNT